MAYKYIESKERVYAKAYRLPIYGAGSINIKNLYPNIDTSLLTNDDFVCSYVSDVVSREGESHSTYGQSSDWWIYATAFRVNHSYNPSTGILNVSYSEGDATKWKDPNTSDGSSFQNLRIEVIMIVDGVRSEYT